MLQAVQLPTSITDLNSGLTNVDRNTLTLKWKEKRERLNFHIAQNMEMIPKRFLRNIRVEWSEAFACNYSKPGTKDRIWKKKIVLPF